MDALCAIAQAVTVVCSRADVYVSISQHADGYYWSYAACNLPSGAKLNPKTGALYVPPSTGPVQINYVLQSAPANVQLVYANMSTVTANGGTLSAQIKQVSFAANYVSIVYANTEKSNFGINLLARDAQRPYVVIQSPDPQVTNEPYGP